MQILYETSIPEDTLLWSYAIKSLEAQICYKFTPISNHVLKGLSDSSEKTDYQLQMTNDLISITENNRTSLFYCIQTLLQLTLSRTYSDKTITSSLEKHSPNLEWEDQSLVKVTDSHQFGYRRIIFDFCENFPYWCYHFNVWWYTTL